MVHDFIYVRCTPLTFYVSLVTKTSHGTAGDESTTVYGSCQSTTSFLAFSVKQEPASA